jgi:hypothetical protein
VTFPLRALTLALLASAAIGCQKGDALVVVTVSSTVPVDNIASYGGTATANGKQAPITFDAAAAAKLPSALDANSTQFSFGVRVPAADTGPFEITLSAFDAMMQPLQSATDGTSTSPGSVAKVTLTFGVVNTDAGADGLGDGGSCPMTCEEAGVGCGVVTTVCGLTLTCPKPCTVTAVEPIAGHVGQTITLEGRFGKNTMVTFGGNVNAPVTPLGPLRATVTVPSGAITGPISVNGGFGSAADFKVTTFPLGLGNWNNTYPQTDTARLVPQMAVDRSLHAVLTVGHTVLAIGGTQNGPSGTALNTFESAYINADGTLGRFTPWATTGPNARFLVTGRVGHAALQTGNSVLVLGGFDNVSTIYNTVEHADVNGDGSGIQTFVNNPTSMNTGRYLMAARIIGDYVYVFGGVVSGSIFDQTAVATDSIERAAIVGKGLGMFETVASKMTTQRAGANVEIVGNKLYVLGGLNSGGTITTIESATINGDGSLGPFAQVSQPLDDLHAAYASIVLDDKLYLIGGIGTVTGKPMPDNISTVVVSTIAGDGSLGPFTKLPGTMTRVRAAFGQGALVGNNYYVVGGGGGGGNSVLDVEYTSLNASGDIGPFTTYAKTTAGHRTQPAMLVEGNRLYLFGGTSSDSKSIEWAPIGPDGSLGNFTMLSTTMAKARGGAFPVDLNGQIYIYGGGGSDGYLADSEIFIPQQDGSLNTNGTGPPMTSTRQSFQMVAIPNAMAGGGSLYALGGDSSVAGTDNSEERITIDPINGYPTGGFLGSAPPAFTVPHSRVPGALIGGSYYLFGQYNIPGSGVTDESPITNMGGLMGFAASSNGVLTHDRWDGPMAVNGPRLLLYSGSLIAGTPPMQKVDPSTDTVPIILNGTGGTQLGSAFSNLAGSAPVQARRGSVMTVLGNYVYVLGGYAGTDLNIIESAPLK